MRIAVLGASGQLGSELCHRFPTDEVIPFERREADVTDAASVNAALRAARPDLVINATAYNFVDRAEEEPEAAYAVNALGPRNLATWCESTGASLLHVSTDYVFTGCAGHPAGVTRRAAPHHEEDAPDPAGAYAVSKLSGEYFVRALCRRHFVVRTCGLYGRGQGGKGNFVDTMLRFGRERPELRIVNDQRCTPTSASDLADAVVALVRTERYGLYHATNTGETTWFDFAKEIFRQTGIAVKIRPIGSSDYGAKARRPTYSVLNCSKLERALGRPMRPWQEALHAYLGSR